MNHMDAAQIYKGVILVVAPHMDDEMLACGATLAALPDKRSIHVIYASDGARSPVPDLPWGAQPDPELVPVRMAEAGNALEVLGIPVANATFLGLPDGRLKDHESGLSGQLAAIIGQIRPDHVFAPFRLDRHPDHLAVHRATVNALRAVGSRASLNEYFVYFRWRLLPGGDVRNMIRADLKVCIPVGSREQEKRRALACYTSQTTKYFAWQDRPILAPGNIEEVCTNPECFLRTEAESSDHPVFTGWRLWIACVHVLEPRLKQAKEWARTIWRRVTMRSARGIRT
jgi:LmbE family N-acetylglucosaminyl deacetylase